MQTPWDVGVDVASRSVVVASAGQRFATRTVANEREALRGWLRELPTGSRVGMEATGGYHQLLAELAHAAGMTVYVLNPRDVKKYAEGVGRRGKTDRLDAEVIARYVAREHPELHGYIPRSAVAQRLEQLLKRRAQVVRLQVGLSQTWRGVSGVKAKLAAVAAAQARLLARVDRLVEEAVDAVPALRAHAQQLRSIPGYGRLGSVAVAHALQWLPFTRVDAFIAHTGLDPRPRDSGEKRGRRRISKRGPAALRTIMPMCAMAASRTPTWRAYYQRQLAKGLSGTEALVILARKMARTAYGIYRSDSPFDRARLSTA
jgi:transposase